MMRSRLLLLLLAAFALNGCGRGAANMEQGLSRSPDLSALYNVFNQVQGHASFQQNVQLLKAGSLAQIASALVTDLSNDRFRLKGETFRGAHDLAAANPNLAGTATAFNAQIGPIETYLEEHGANFTTITQADLDAFGDDAYTFYKGAKDPAFAAKTAALSPAAVARGLNTLVFMHTLQLGLTAYAQPKPQLNLFVQYLIGAILMTVDEALKAGIAVKDMEAGSYQMYIDGKKRQTSDTGVDTKDLLERRQNLLNDRYTPPATSCNQAFIDSHEPPTALSKANKTFICNGGSFTWTPLGA